MNKIAKVAIVFVGSLGPIIGAYVGWTQGGYDQCTRFLYMFAGFATGVLVESFIFLFGVALYGVACWIMEEPKGK